MEGWTSSIVDAQCEAPIARRRTCPIMHCGRRHAIDYPGLMSYHRWIIIFRCSAIYEIDIGCVRKHIRSARSDVLVYFFIKKVRQSRNLKRCLGRATFATTYSIQRESKVASQNFLQSLSEITSIRHPPVLSSLFFSASPHRPIYEAAPKSS